MRIRRRALPVLLACVLSGTRATAQDAQDPRPDPALLGLTVILENVAPGNFSASNGIAQDCLVTDFFVFVSDLATNIRNIEKLRVEDENGRGWTIDPIRYGQVARGYIGGYGRWHSDSDSLVPRTLVPLTYVVEMTLTSKRVIRETFDTPAPDPLDAESPPFRFVANDPFRGLRTPYHASAIRPATILWVHGQDNAIRVAFTISDPRVMNGQLHLYDHSGASLGSGPELRDPHGDWPAWVNEGAPLRTDGSVNVIALPMSQVRWRQAAGPERAVAGVVLSLMEWRSPQTNLLRSTYLYQSRTGIHTLTPDSPVTTLFRADTRVLLAEAAAKAAATPPSPVWDDDPASVRRWEVAIPGILTVLSDYQFDTLAPFPATGANRRRAEAAIRSGWGITDRESLIEQLTWLRQEGHDDRYRTYERLLDANPGVADAQLLASSGDPRLAERGFEFVRRFRSLTGSRGVLAWDMCRLIFLARDGYVLGHLTEEEAWGWIDHAAGRVRENYDSWLDLGNAYLLGRMYWGGPDRDARLYLEASRGLKMLLDEGGAWTRIPWPPKLAAESSHSQDLP